MAALAAVAAHGLVKDYGSRPYSWAFDGTPLSSGPDAGGLGLLYGGALVLLVVAVLALERRDLGA